MPRIYKKYITDQAPAIDAQIDKSYSRSRLFILSHDVQQAAKPEAKGVLGSVFGMFAKKAPEAPASILSDV